MSAGLSWPAMTQDGRCCVCGTMMTTGGCPRCVTQGGYASLDHRQCAHCGEPAYRHSGHTLLCPRYFTFKPVGSP